MGAQSNFICPEKDGLFEDTQQCDKYYDCFDGIPEDRLCPDGLVFDPFSRKREPCDHYFNVTVATDWNSSNRRAPVTCAPVSMVSTPTRTPPSVTSSTPVWMARQRSTPAPPASGLMSTAASVTGQRPPTGRNARLRPMLWRLLMASNVLLTLPLMSLASSTLTPSTPIPTTAPSSSFA